MRSSTFAASVSRLYAVLTLVGLPAGTKLGYVRYIDGNFVDSKSAVTGPNSKYFYFEFAAKDPSKTLHAGHYRPRLYINERAAREISYTVGR